MDQLIVVSMDSHAQAPPEAWPEYLEARYHEYLPQLHEDNVIYNTVMTTLAEQNVQTPENVAVYDTEHAYRDGGYLGVWDRDLRLREMDREGIAAEFVYQGDHRATSLFNNVFSRRYDLDVVRSGGAGVPPLAGRRHGRFRAPAARRRGRVGVRRRRDRCGAALARRPRLRGHVPARLPRRARGAAVLRRVLGAGVAGVRGARPPALRARGLRPRTRPHVRRGEADQGRDGRVRRPGRRRAADGGRGVPARLLLRRPAAAAALAAHPRRRVRPSSRPAHGDDRGAVRLAPRNVARARRAVPRATATSSRLLTHPPSTGTPTA